MREKLNPQAQQSLSKVLNVKRPKSKCKNLSRPESDTCLQQEMLLRSCTPLTIPIIPFEYAILNQGDLRGYCKNITLNIKISKSNQTLLRQKIE